LETPHLGCVLATWNRLFWQKKKQTNITLI